MRIGKDILSVLLIVAALAWTLWFVFAGFGNAQDPLYWLYKFEHLEGGWMAAGTLLAGGAVVRLFGAQLLPLRLVGWLCVVAAIALPYCCLLSKEQRRENIHWLALTYLLMGYGAFQEFSPGTLTVLLLSLLWVCVEWYRRSGNGLWPVLCAGVVTGLAVTVRFPNILALPLALLALHSGQAIIARHETRYRLTLTIAALITAGVVYGFSLWLVTPAATDTAMSSHEMRAMLLKLWQHGGQLAGYLFIAFGAIALGEKMNLESPVSNDKYTISNIKYKIILGCAVGLLLIYFIAYTMRPTQWYNTDLTYFISAFCLVLALNANPLTANPLNYGAAILIVATLGTDTAWLKLFPAVLCLLPVAGVQYEQATRRYLWSLLMVVAIMVAVRFSTNSVGKTNLLATETRTLVAPYEHIAITEAEQERLEQYKADYDSLSSNPLTVIALGQDNHLIRAVTGCEAARYNEFWSNIFDSVYTAKYRPIIEAERPVIFCAFSPQFKTKKIYQDRQSAMENMIRELGYREIDRSAYRYVIYVPE